MGIAAGLHGLLFGHEKADDKAGNVLIVTEVRGLLDKYLEWLRDMNVLRQVGDWTEITTPHLDRHNDYLQIYAKKQDGTFLLTDDGYVLGDLEQSGCELSSTKRQQLLRLTLSGFGVQLVGKALQVVATTETFPVKKHNLLQAMLAVNDMFYLSQPMVASVFYEDVVAWLDLHEIRYTPHVKFTGKTGFDPLLSKLAPDWVSFPRFHSCLGQEFTSVKNQVPRKRCCLN